MAKKKAPMKKTAAPGRKNVYDSHIKPYLEEIKCWVRLGYTQDSISKRLGVSLESFYKYKREKSEFSEAIKQGKEKVDALSIDKLIQSMTGFEIEEVEITLDETGQEIGRKIKKKVIPPNVTALQFYMKNRMGEHFNIAEKKEISHSGGVNLSHITDEELEEELKKLKGDM